MLKRPRVSTGSLQISAMRQFTPKEAFTLVEIIVVIILSSVLGSLAIPKFITVLERFRADEGRQTLMTVYGAQKRFFAENRAYAAALATLDIELRTLSYFTLDNVFEAGATPFLGTMTRIGNTYTLKINANGSMTCTSGTGICERIGF